MKLIIIIIIIIYLILNIVYLKFVLERSVQRCIYQCHRLEEK